MSLSTWTWRRWSPVANAARLTFFYTSVRLGCCVISEEGVEVCEAVVCGGRAVGAEADFVATGVHFDVRGLSVFGDLRERDGDEVVVCRACLRQRPCDVPGLMTGSTRTCGP